MSEKRVPIRCWFCVISCWHPALALRLNIYLAGRTKRIICRRGSLSTQMYVGHRFGADEMKVASSMGLSIWAYEERDRANNSFVLAGSGVETKYALPSA